MILFVQNFSLLLFFLIMQPSPVDWGRGRTIIALWHYQTTGGELRQPENSMSLATAIGGGISLKSEETEPCHGHLFKLLGGNSAALSFL